MDGGDGVTAIAMARFPELQCLRARHSEEDLHILVRQMKDTTLREGTVGARVQRNQFPEFHNGR